ncbi:MAG TPA: ferredoxin reductase [Thermoleophilaceae bacterium]
MERLAGTEARLSWRVATITESKPESPHAKTLVLDVPGWPGQRAGQHVDIRLTAEDGYQSERSYSIASAPETPALELTIDRVEDGEVSPYLTEEARPGDQFELRGPVGGYFVWEATSDQPLLLVAGGSGLVPLMAILRQHELVGSGAGTRLLLSARTLEDVLYRQELEALRDRAEAVTVHLTLTRDTPPPEWSGWARRVDRAMLEAVGPGPDARPRVYVCGPTPFVEEAAGLLVEIGYDPRSVHTERFGG